MTPQCTPHPSGCSRLLMLSFLRPPSRSHSLNSWMVASANWPRRRSKVGKWHQHPVPSLSLEKGGSRTRMGWPGGVQDVAHTQGTISLGNGWDEQYQCVALSPAVMKFMGDHPLRGQTELDSVCTILKVNPLCGVVGAGGALSRGWQLCLSPALCRARGPAGRGLLPGREADHQQQQLQAVSPCSRAIHHPCSRAIHHPCWHSTAWHWGHSFGDMWGCQARSGSMGPWASSSFPQG